LFPAIILSVQTNTSTFAGDL